jgi:hypothetical protein
MVALLAVALLADGCAAGRWLHWPMVALLAVTLLADGCAAGRCTGRKVLPKPVKTTKPVTVM